MEELAEILTWSTLDLHSKPVAILNVDGYYDHFLLWVSVHLLEQATKQQSSLGAVILIL